MLISRCGLSQRLLRSSASHTLCSSVLRTAEGVTRSKCPPPPPPPPPLRSLAVLRWWCVRGSKKKRMPPKKKEVADPATLLGRFGTSLKCGIVGLPNVG